MFNVKMRKLISVLLSLFILILNLNIQNTVAESDDSVDGSGSHASEEEISIPTSKSEKALHQLKEFIGIRGKVSNFKPPSTPPEYMVELYNKISDRNIKDEDKNPYNAQIVRGYVETDRDFRNDTVQNIFKFDVTGFEKGEFVLEAELRLYRKGEPVNFSSLSQMPYHLVKVYQILHKRGLHEPDLHRLLNIQYVSIFDSKWHIYNVKQAVQDWLNGAPNLGLLVTASTVIGDPMKIEYIRRENDTDNSKQPMLVLFNSDGKQEKVKENLDVSCEGSENLENTSSSDSNSETKNCSNMELRKINQRRKRQIQGEFEKEFQNYQNHDTYFLRRKGPKPEMTVNQPKLRKVLSAMSLKNNFNSQIISTRRQLDDILKSMTVYERAVFQKMLNTQKVQRRRRPPKLLVDRTRRFLRKKRSSESRSACVKSDLNVDFDVVGLGSRIIAPKKYEAYQCKGLCYSTSQQNRESTNHAFIRAILRDMDLKNDIEQVSCVPTKLLNSAILYYDEHKNIILKIYDDMIVDECGCR